MHSCLPRMAPPASSCSWERLLKSMLLRSTARATVLAPPGLQEQHRQPMHASQLPHSAAENGQDSPLPAAYDAAGHPGWGRSSSSRPKSLHAVLGLGTRLGHNRSTKHLELRSRWAADWMQSGWGE